jgi:hypothetical protein
MVVHIVGAPHTGAAELFQALTAQLGPSSVRMPDCTGGAFTEAAQSPPPVTTALATAGAALGTPERAHAAHAANGHASDATALVLLMGLDWPCPDEAQELREQRDAQLRSQLQQQRTPYSVLYGSADRRLAHALAAFETALPPTAVRGSTALQTPSDAGTEPASSRLPPADAGADEAGSARWRNWGCEKCSDPVCEHRLFTSLRLQSTPEPSP